MRSACFALCIIAMQHHVLKEHLKLSEACNAPRESVAFESACSGVHRRRQDGAECRLRLWVRAHTTGEVPGTHISLLSRGRAQIEVEPH